MTTRNDRGYAVVLSALLIVPLLAFAGFATDVGSWYAQANRQQRAADAAALAGVVWLPDVTEATAVALDIARDNGFDDADPQITVSVERVAEQQLRVTIHDAAADQFFSPLFVGAVDITRRATAEYVLPLPLGSPENRFGTGNQTMGGTASNIWAAVNGYCTAKEQGDQLLSRYDGNKDQCLPPTGTAAYHEDNADYDPDGYWYVIDVPDGPRSTVNVRIFDGGSLCTSSPAGDLPPAVPLEFTLYAADDTPLDDDDNPVATTKTFGTTEGCNAWTTIYSIGGGEPAGRWLLQATTPHTPYVNPYPSSFPTSNNDYGVWAQMGSSSGYCNSLVTTDCASIAGRDRISVFVNQAGGVARFYLAEVASVHEGKELVIELWDAADAMRAVQVLDPTGAPVDFTWRTVDDDGQYPGPYAAANGCGPAVGKCLDVAGTGPQPGPFGTRLGNRKFNDRLLQLTVQLPNDFSSYPDYFWELRYYTPTGVTSIQDRTTWGARIQGDPVHLVDDID